jgi:uncharacterized membrane protein YdjX (TVP38/TMEM64 family)
MKRKTTLVLLFIAFLVGLFLAFRRYLPLDWLVEHEQELRSAIRSQAVAAWLIGFVIYIGLSLVPVTSGKSMVFGWLFGFWQAVLMVDCALTAAALMTFCFSRLAIRDVVQSRFRPHLERLNRGLERDGAFYLLLLRMMHAPYTFINYACGATNIRPRTFWWTTQLGLLPGTFVFVFAGTRLPTLRELTRQGPLRLLDPWLLGSLALTALFPILVRWVIAQWRKKFSPVAETPASAVRRES